ncbi:MAG: AAA domain-containing protein [Azospirillaceae bacterium]|nr:AAA domain-containing protein [Azospirillaceae bacterium]
MSEDTNRLLDILRFWHKAEFFIPFDLDDRLREKDGRKSLWRAKGETTPVTFANPPANKVVAGYTLYLGVFDKSEAPAIVSRALPAGPGQDDRDRYEDEQRGDLEGRTCIASLRLDAAACPQFETVEVSSLPWAVARVRENGLEALTGEAFSTARMELANRIANFRTRRVAEGPLQPAEVGALATLFTDWAGFRPAPGQPEAALEVLFKDAPKDILRKAPETTPVPKDTAPSDAEEEEEEDGPEDQPEIGILNSFFIDDIEMVMADVAAGRVPETVRGYLTPLPGDGRLDLYTEVGRRKIVETLAPGRMNRGRWLSDPGHAMSLMQQFAVNTAREHLASSGLASVNGPPGTGKTTLLRDIIADTIVSRARVLAGLDSAKAAFDGRITVPGKAGPLHLSTLIPALTGFEMVVASSNNAAVENISHDLPKRASVRKGEDFGYLQRVAHKVAAQKGDGSCRRLSNDDMPWGLIACALGRAANRRGFAARLLGLKIKPEAYKAGGDRPLTLWEWRTEVPVPPFHDAAKAFNAAEKAVEALIAQMAEYADLHQQLSGRTRHDWCDEAERALAAAQAASHGRWQALTLAQEQANAAQAGLSALAEEERLIDRQAPSLWQRLWGTATARQHRAQVRANAEAQLRQHDVLNKLKRQVSEAQAAHDQAQANLATAERRRQAAADDWTRLDRAHRGLRDRFGAITPPANLDDLEGDAPQKAGLWHLPELADLRSELFRAALRLHEAWLAEVSVKGGGFGHNLMACELLLQGGVARDAAALQAIWQSLFMVVPVVSCTFASYARQFRGLGAASLGWLFIDEAGQAVPQAAVGALHRAQRALVIGDPLQIEPVFTLPKRLITDLAALSPHTRGGSYSPDMVSVQVLADAANPLGTSVPTEGGDPIWIGSPLRVHRRCIDPMFHVANTIAYQGKMVFGPDHRLPPGDAAPFFGASAWIDIGGTVEGRQSVPAQTAFVARLLAATYAEFGTLPDVYVISPFKEVKEKLVRAISLGSGVWDDGPHPTASVLNRWSARIGTVHTFQGKEEDTVIMVLGTDAETQGAAQWAASKPNLLNVALTRAKRRFFMVGDHGLWAGQSFFSDAAQALPPIQPDAFMDRASAAWRTRPGR